MRVPYIVGPPVRQPTDFFGRAAQTRQFFDTLAGPQVQCVSVLGLRRAGKTSFLQHVAHPAVMAGFLSDAARYAMIYVDVSACRTPGEFYGRVARRLQGLLSPRAGGGSAQGHFAQSHAAERHDAPAEADVYAVESLLYELAGRRVVLLLDEFDQLRTAGFGGDFLTELRALAGVWEYELGFVTASYWDLFRLGNFVGLPVTSPFYNIFHPSPIYLSGLSPAELDELVRVPARRVGIDAGEADVAAVGHIAGSLPFFVQATAAVWLGDRLAGRASEGDDVLARLVPEMGPYFEQWWRNLSDVEGDTLLAMAREQPLARLPYGQAEVAAAVRRLNRYGIVVLTGERPWVDGALLRQWLRENRG